MNRRLFCSGLITAPALLAKPGKPVKVAGTAPAAGCIESGRPRVVCRVDARDWSRLRANVAANDYYPAALSWNGVSLPSVRVRARGRSSRNAVKPGLRVDLRAKGGKSGLAKVEGFVLNNLANDPSGLHDWLAMKIFRKAGIAAPRRSFARVFVNREEAGLFAVGEEIDDRFLQRHFRENGGFLYQYHADESGPVRQAKRQVDARAVIENGRLAPAPAAATDLRHLAQVLAAESFCDDRQREWRGPDGCISMPRRNRRRRT